jgi:heterodisulfide reductase subunit B
MAERLDIKLNDMPGSSCCGTTYLETLDQDTALAMAARNITIAEEMDMDILTLCNGCTEVLTKANYELKRNDELRDRINGILSGVGREFKGSIEVKHMVRVLKEDLGLDRLREAVRKPFQGLRAAAHYGCHMLKPSEILQWDDPENPTSMDELITAMGIEAIQYPNKNECCAGPIMGIRENVTWDVGLDKVRTVKKLGDILVTACPFCYLTYERCQLMREETSKLPIVHLPQLIGLAAGLGEEEVGLAMNKIDATWITERQGGYDG